MPTELEELVEFLHHGNTPIRQIAAENLVPFSTSQPSLFKGDAMQPVTDLKLLIRDYAPIARNALLMLINLSANESDILEALVKDTKFVEAVIECITNKAEPNANEMAMLLANLAKSEDLLPVLMKSSGTDSPLPLGRLLDCFVRGADGHWNPKADFDYLAYVFADLAKHVKVQKFFTTQQRTQNQDELPPLPLATLTIFTTHTSEIRRLGVASTIKNISFHLPAHKTILGLSESHVIERSNSVMSSSINSPCDILPSLLLPLMGPEDYADEEMDALPDECQLLGADKERETSSEILCTHLETLMVLTTTREIRDSLRARGVYPVLRELHLKVTDEDVKRWDERVVDVLMRREEGEEISEDERRAMNMAFDSGIGGEHGQDLQSKKEKVEEDEEDQIIDVI